MGNQSKSNKMNLERRFTDAEAPYERLVNSIMRPTVHFKTPFVIGLTRDVVEGIRILLTTEGYKVRTGMEQKSIDHIVDLFAPLDDGQAVKAVKYLTAVYLPIVGKDDQMPERPSFLDEHSTLFVAEYGRFVKRLFANHGRTTRRQVSLAMSILQLKRYCRPLSATLQDEARKGLKERLTSPAITPERLLDEVVRTANELFPRGWDKGVPVPSYVPSKASCVQNTRGDGGIQAYVTRSGFEKDRYQGCEGGSYKTVDLSKSGKGKAKWHPSPYGDFDPRLAKAKEDILKDGDLDDLPRHRMNHMSQDEVEDLALRTAPYPLRAVVEIVEDPLKARVITRNEWQCQVLKPLQKMIHGRMRKHPAFQLIGRTIDEEVMSHLTLFEGAKWVSGDYSAATDNFHSDVTEAAIDTIVSNMVGKIPRERPELLMLARRSLTGLTVVDNELEEEYVMSRGQLMGSLLSFPILCLVNFAIWRHSAEQAYGRACDGCGKGGVEDHVLINGDDIGFAATPEHYKLWMKLVPQVGLTPSMGKNYFSREFITLNTRVFMWSETRHCLTNVGFLNLGLLKRGGDNAKNGQTHFEKLEALGKMHDDFVEGAAYRGSASSIFITSWKHLLKTTVRNLFGPREHGGLGAHPVKGSKGATLEGYSWRQMIIAKLLKDEKVRIPSTGIIPRYRQYEEAYVSKRFPNVEEFRGEPPQAPDGYAWENVSEMVEDTRASFRTLISWLAPSGDVQKPQRDFWRQCSKYSKWRQYRRSALMSIDEYYLPEAERLTYRLVHNEWLSELESYDLSEEHPVWV